MRHLKVLASSLALALTSCATPEQRAEHLLATYGPFCQKLGHQPGTEGFAACVQQQHANDVAASQRAIQIYQQTRPRTCTTYGAQTTCY